jgi:long-chain acyl-CoA synthetase
LAMQRLLTMSNLFENLCEIYGDREIIRLAEPAAYRLFHSPELTCGDCLRFTNLAAEAFIRDLDLKKGERIVLCIPESAEMLLIAVALIKAGGIAVPLDHRLPAGEIAQRVQGCGATLAVVDRRVIAERVDFTEGIPGIERIMVSGPRSQVPDGVPSLDEAMDLSSGFFLPYTLKPGNVVGLFHTVMGDGSLKAVMVTNEGLLGPQRWAAAFFSTRPGDPCVHAVSMWSADGFSTSVLGLCMGLRMRFIPDKSSRHIPQIVEAEKPAALIVSSETCASLLQACIQGDDLSSIRLWLTTGRGLPYGMFAEYRRSSPQRSALLHLPARLIEAYSAGGNATVLALKPDLLYSVLPEGCPGLVIPPNRICIVDEMGRRVGRGEEGELAIRGPAVTQGYWNDIEVTMSVKRNGWLYTGIRATRNRFLITLR